MGLISKQVVVKEGMRKRVQLVASKVSEVEMALVRLQGELENHGVLSSFDDERADDDEENEEYDEEALESFRRGLVAGAPVHVVGLASRAELNGCAGILGGWFQEKGRWEVKIGSKGLLVKPGNLVP